MSSWWWVKYHQKYVEQFKDLNKLYPVASSWIIIAILYDARSIEHKMYFCSYSSLNFIFFSLLFDVLNDIYFIMFYFDSICLFSLTFLRRIMSLSAILHILNLVIYFFLFTLLHLHVVLLNYMEIFRYQVENLWGEKLPISLVVFLFCSRLFSYEMKRVCRITDFLTLFSFLINWNVLLFLDLNC